MMGLCQIWLTDNLYCVVDEIDFAWAKQWKWHATANSTGKKFYATRNTRAIGDRGRQIKIYMHKDILLRSGKIQPSPKHTIGDHQDGESLHNWRDNLEWATPSINRQNTGGFHARQQALWR